MHSIKRNHQITWCSVEIQTPNDVALGTTRLLYVYLRLWNVTSDEQPLLFHQFWYCVLHLIHRKKPISHALLRSKMCTVLQHTNDVTNRISPTNQPNTYSHQYTLSRIILYKHQQKFQCVQRYTLILINELNCVWWFQVRSSIAITVIDSNFIKYKNFYLTKIVSYAQWAHYQWFVNCFNHFSNNLWSLH